MSSSRTQNLIRSRNLNINNCNSLKSLTAIAYTLCQAQLFMGITSYIGAIASAVSRNKNKQVNTKQVGTTHTIHTCTKEQHLKWIEEGKCQCCGAESSEYTGICDECRLS